MPSAKIFTLAEATALLPELRNMLAGANKELTEKAEILANAYADHESCEQEMSKVKVVKAGKDDDDKSLYALRECRLNFQTSIESLEQAKKAYIQALNFWLDEISQTGVILRDIKSGLLDFPAQSGRLRYYLCWQATEDNIQYWHPTDEGFSSRKPLSVLSEYL